MSEILLKNWHKGSFRNALGQFNFITRVNRGQLKNSCNGIEGGRKTSCMACQQKKRILAVYMHANYAGLNEP